MTCRCGEDDFEKCNGSGEPAKLSPTGKYLTKGEIYTGGMRKTLAEGRCPKCNTELEAEHWCANCLTDWSDSVSRGTGRSTQQMLRAPYGAIYVAPNAKYHMDLAREHNRDDLKVITPATLENSHQFAGRRISGIVIDHAAVPCMTKVQWGIAEHIDELARSQDEYLLHRTTIRRIMASASGLHRLLPSETLGG